MVTFTNIIFSLVLTFYLARDNFRDMTQQTLTLNLVFIEKWFM